MMKSIQNVDMLMWVPLQNEQWKHIAKIITWVRIQIDNREFSGDFDCIFVSIHIFHYHSTMNILKRTPLSDKAGEIWW